MNKNEIELKSYTWSNCLKQDDAELAYRFMKGIITWEDIGDRLIQTAEDMAKIHSNRIFDNAKGLHDCGAYEEAAERGYMPTDHNLEQSLSAACSRYNWVQLKHNLDALIYNYAIEYVKDNSRYIVADELYLQTLEAELQNIELYDSFQRIIDLIWGLSNNRPEELLWC